MQQKRDKTLNLTVLKAAAVLDMFTAENPELSFTAIRQKLDLPNSTTHRILTTLCHVGYVCQDKETGKYYLGLKCFQLGSQVKVTKELKSAAAEYMEELSLRYNEVSHLTINNGSGSVMCVIQTRINQSFFAFPGPGGTRDMQVTAAGKCMLAFMPPDELERTIPKLSFKRYTSHSIVTPQQLREHLKIVRNAGYATEREESERGLYCCGAPIFLNDICIAAVSVSMPVGRLISSEEALKEEVMETAAKISNALPR